MNAAPSTRSRSPPFSGSSNCIVGAGSRVKRPSPPMFRPHGSVPTRPWARGGNAPTPVDSTYGSARTGFSVLDQLVSPSLIRGRGKKTLCASAPWTSPNSTAGVFSRRRSAGSAMRYQSAGPGPPGAAPFRMSGIPDWAFTGSGSAAERSWRAVDHWPSAGSATAPRAVAANAGGPAVGCGAGATSMRFTVNDWPDAPMSITQSMAPPNGPSSSMIEARCSGRSV